MRIRAIWTALMLFAVAGCGQSEDYQVGASDAYAKVVGAAFAEGISPLPVGLTGANVSVRFQSIPTDRTAYWVFSKNGKELGRLNVAVAGDESESTVSYSYAEGPGASEFGKVAKQVKQHMPNLITEAVDARIEGRPIDVQMKREADKATTLALVGDMMNDVQSSFDDAVKQFDAQDRERKMAKIDKQAREAQAGSTEPMMKLGGN